MRISSEGILEIWISPRGKGRWCTVCPSSNRKTIIWETHKLAHSGIHRTVSRIQLVWYWPNMVAEVRRLLKSCEVCQLANPGGTHQGGGRQWLYAGRPWQKLAVDLAGPIPTTARGNFWVLLLMNHFARWQDAIALPEATCSYCGKNSR